MEYKETAFNTTEEAQSFVEKLNEKAYLNLDWTNRENLQSITTSITMVTLLHRKKNNLKLYFQEKELGTIPMGNYLTLPMLMKVISL